MTEGPVTSRLLAFAVPMLLSSLFNLLYSAVDGWVLGNFVSDTGFAAVGSIDPINNIVINTTNGFATGIGIVFAQFFGAKDEEQLKRTRSAAVFLIAFFGILCTVIGVCFTPAMLRLTDIPEELFEEARIYLTFLFAVSLFRVVNMVVPAMLRAIGDTGRPVFINICCNCLNIPLNLFFVLVLEMGVAGVALATVICIVLESVLYMRILLTDASYVRIRLKEIRYYPDNLRMVVKVAIPISIQLLITSSSNLMYRRYMNVLGSDVAGGFASFQHIENVTNLVMSAISLSISNFVGQNIGAGNIGRAKEGIRKGLIVSGGFAAASAVIMIPAAPYAAAFFSKNEEFIYYACYLTRMIMPFTVFHSIMHGLLGALRGAGNSRAAMVMSLACFVGIRQVYLFVMTRLIGYTVDVIFCGIPVSWITGAVLFIVYYLRNDLDKRRVV